MRVVIGVIVLFVIAVVTATLFGTNEGQATFTWRGWRAELSLNFFLLLLVAACFAMVSAILALRALVTLPQRAREWQAARRDRVAQTALRESLAQFFGGRYSRSQRAAERALAVQADTPEMAQDNDFSVLAHLLAAGSAHRLQDRAGRDRELKQALDLSRRSGPAKAVQDGARLLAAEWALDDRDADRALEHLAELPPGAARRTQALRLRLAATRMNRQPAESLRTARLLAKHQGFSRTGAQGLLRSLAFELLETARDAEQLKRVWTQLDSADRRDPLVAARAASLAVRSGSLDDARNWVLPFWPELAVLPDDEREALLRALIPAIRGIGADWLPRVETLAQLRPRDPLVALVAGLVCRERELWGMAQKYLSQAAEDTALDLTLRRRAWRDMAEQAESNAEPDKAAAAYVSAAKLG
jgi:HemY protein